MMVAIDIDGTITKADRKIDIHAIKAIERLESNSIPVILATGNVMCFAETVSVLLGTTGPLIAENGGIVRIGKEYLYLSEPSLSKKAFEYLKKIVGAEIVDTHKLRETEVAIRRNLEVKRVRELLRNFDVNVVDTGYAIHIHDKRVNKGIALRKISEKIGLQRENLFAIGDHENDIEMLEYAGTSFALANSDEKLKRIATFCTKGAYGKGVLEAAEIILNIVG
ncbi:MAG: phosphoglycolate phosphatase [Candidatus Hydrothermarchaeota archaeon]